MTPCVDIQRRLVTKGNYEWGDCSTSVDAQEDLLPRATVSEMSVPQVPMAREALSPKETVSEVIVRHVSMPQEAFSQREIVSVPQVSMPREASSPRETANEVIVPHVSMPREANWRPAIVVGEGIEREKIDKRSVRPNEKKKTKQKQKNDKSKAKQKSKHSVSERSDSVTSSLFCFFLFEILIFIWNTEFQEFDLMKP